MELTEEIKKQRNNALRRRVYRTIQSMYCLFRSQPRNIQIVNRYLDIWKPRSNDVKDVIDFPYESKKGSLAEKKDGIQCLFALITEMIKLWHTHCKSEDNQNEALELLLDKIEFLIKNKLTFPIRGSEETGYYFKLPKGK